MYCSTCYLLVCLSKWVQRKLLFLRLIRMLLFRHYFSFKFYFSDQQVKTIGNVQWPTVRSIPPFHPIHPSIKMQAYPPHIFKTQIIYFNRMWNSFLLNTERNKNKNNLGSFQTSTKSTLDPQLQQLNNLPHFLHNMSFPWKIQSSPFYQHFNACHQVKFQKHLMSRFRENFIRVDLGPKNNALTP